MVAVISVNQDVMVLHVALIVCIEFVLCLVFWKL